MILPVNDAPEWSSDNASELSGFLKTGTGEKLVQIMCFFAPSLLDGSDVNKTLVASGEVKGYTNAVAQLVSLQTSRPVETQGVPDTYPDIDNDQLWADSEKDSPAPK